MLSAYPSGITPTSDFSMRVILSSQLVKAPHQRFSVLALVWPDETASMGTVMLTVDRI